VRARSILSWFFPLALASCWLLPGRVGAAEPRIERKPEFVSRVNSAIENGVKWLRGAQQPGGLYREYPGYAGGTTALAYYTLRTCGVAKDDPAAVRAFSAMKQTFEAAKRRGELTTYTVALFCMALAERAEIAPAADKQGGSEPALSAEDVAWMKELVRLLEEWQDERGRWWYPREGGNGRAYDNSNTQYALLGLKAASRAGAKVKSSTWSRSLKHFLDAQEDGGPSVPRFQPGEKGRTNAAATDRARGWGYQDGGGAYGSMTAGGVGSVVICRSELLGSSNYPPGLDAKAEQSVRDGVAWLGRWFAVDTNPAPPVSRQFTMGGPMWHYYYLYALERAGVLAGVEWMGEHDWYGEGAEFLLKDQLASGAWAQADGPAAGAVPMGRPAAIDDTNSVISTAFALLFLKKGTLPVARGALTKSFDDGDINFVAAPSLSDADFDDFVDLVLSRWRRAATDEAKSRILTRATAVGPRLVLPLIDRLSSTKDPEREAAFALLRRATGLDHGYLPGAPRETRDDAVARWQSWWLANGKLLWFDPASGRLVVAR
jgi:hypothetical protein